jgi:hypothetical protein
MARPLSSTAALIDNAAQRRKQIRCPLNLVNDDEFAELGFEPWPRISQKGTISFQFQVQIDGALAHCSDVALRIFAGQLLRDMLIAALRQEGHLFTEQRFYAWFAGIATLADETPRLARSARAICEAVLTELAHSSWDPLAALALGLQRALLAPQDHTSGDTNANAHEDARAIISDARHLLGGLAAAPSPLPLVSLARLHHT